MTTETMLTLAAVGAILSLAVVVATACVECFDTTVDESEDVPPEEERAYLLALSGVITFPRNH